MNLFVRISFVVLLLLVNLTVYGQCDVSKIVSNNKSLIDPPYQYDGFLIHDMPFVSAPNAPKVIHSEFIAFEKQVYKVIFCSSGFEEEVKISIYNKKNPKIVVAEQIINSGTQRWIFEPLQSGVYDIVYTPASSDYPIEHKGCIIMLIGFKK